MRDFKSNVNNLLLKAPGDLCHGRLCRAPTEVPTMFAVRAVFLNSEGESEHFSLMGGTVAGPFPAPEDPDYTQQLARLTSDRLYARSNIGNWYSDDDIAWAAGGVGGDNNSSLIEVGNTLFVGTIGGIHQSLTEGAAWAFNPVTGNPVAFASNGTVVMSITSSTANKAYRKPDLLSAWVEIDLTGKAWSGPEASGFNQFGAGVGDTFVFAGRHTGFNQTAVLVTDDAGLTVDRVNLPAHADVRQIVGIATDGVDILLAQGKSAAPAETVIYRYNIATRTFTELFVIDGFFAGNLWFAEGVWYCPIYTYDGSATWYWSTNKTDWNLASHPGGYNEVLAVAYDAAGPVAP